MRNIRLSIVVVAFTIALSVILHAATFTDTFTEAATVALVSHTADTSGAWTERRDGAGTQSHRVDGTADNVNINSAAGNSFLLTTINWDYAGPDISVSWTADAVPATGTDDPSGVVARYVDSTNYYIAGCYQTGVGTCKIGKEVADTYTELDSCSVTVDAGDVIKFSVIGTALKLYENGSLTACDTTDSEFAAEGLTGLACGSLWASATDDCNAGWQVDDFIVEDEAAPSTPLCGRMLFFGLGC